MRKCFGDNQTKSINRLDNVEFTSFNGQKHESIQNKTNEINLKRKEFQLEKIPCLLESSN